MERSQFATADNYLWIRTPPKLAARDQNALPPTGLGRLRSGGFSDQKRKNRHSTKKSALLSAGQVSDGTGAAALINILPTAQWMLADRVIMLAGSAAPCGKRGYRPASRAAKPGTRPSGAKNAATASRPCSAASTRRDALRSLPKGLLLRRPPRSYRHLLDLINES